MGFISDMQPAQRGSYTRREELKVNLDRERFEHESHLARDVGAACDRYFRRKNLIFRNPFAKRGTPTPPVPPTI